MLSTGITPVTQAIVAGLLGLTLAIGATRTLRRLALDRGAALASLGGIALAFSTGTAIVLSASAIGWHGWTRAMAAFLVGALAVAAINRLPVQAIVVTGACLAGLRPGLVAPWWLDAMLAAAGILFAVRTLGRWERLDTGMTATCVAVCAAGGAVAYAAHRPALGAVFFATSSAAIGVLGYTLAPGRVELGARGRSFGSFVIASALVLIAGQQPSGAPRTITTGAVVAICLLILFSTWRRPSSVWLASGRLNRPHQAEGYEGSMGIADYMRVLWHRWPIIAIAVVLGGVGAGILTARATPLYAGSVTLFVSAPDSRTDTGVSAAYESGLLSQQRVRSYAELMRSRTVAQRLATDLATGVTAEHLMEHILVEPVPESVLLRATVTDPDPAQASRAAELLGAGFSRLVEDLERSASRGSSPVRLTLVGRAEVAPEPVSPRPARNVGLGVLAGLIFGIGGALLRETTDTSVRSATAIRDITGAPNLGVVHYDRATPDRPLLAHIDPHSPRTEAFRTLRTNLTFVNVDSPIRTVLVTSCQSGEGKSTTACNLALSIVEAGKTALIVDGDLRRPRVAEYLGLEGAVGLTNVLIGQAKLGEALQPWGRDGLVVLPSGPVPPNPAELLGSQHMQDLLGQLTRLADVVIVDAPPLLPVADAAVLSRISDGVLLVVRHGRTTREQLRLGREQLDAVGAKLLGHVVNMAPATRTVKYGYGGAYGAPPPQPGEVEIRDLDRLTAG